MPSCDPNIYVEITDPAPPVTRSIVGQAANAIVGDVAICNENGKGITDQINPFGFGSGHQSPLKISSSGASIDSGYREMRQAIRVSDHVMVSDDMGSYPKNQYINNSNIIFDLDKYSIFNIKISRIDRQYTFLLKSNYHMNSSDGERDCVGYVRETAFGDLYIFTDGTSDEALTELPAGRDLEVDELPNYGKFIFETHDVNGKPQTHSTKKILIFIQYTGTDAGTLDITFQEFFDYIALGGGSSVVDEFVYQKPSGFTSNYIMIPNTAFNVGSLSENLLEITINNPTMYVVDSAYDPACIPNYNQTIHNRFCRDLIVQKIL